MTARKKAATKGERDIDLIYQENLLDHYRRPRNFGDLDDPDFSRREANFSCGDDVEFFVRLDQSGKISEIKFRGHGCALSQAASSMLTEHAVGKTPKQVAAMSEEDIGRLLGFDISPARSRCATLGLKALQNGIKEYDKD
jgi:nitrogen fixation NifU-like protein